MLALLRADNYFTSLAQYVLFNLLLLTAGIAILAVWKKAQYSFIQQMVYQYLGKS